MAKRAVLVDLGCGSSPLLESLLAREHFETVVVAATTQAVRQLADRAVEAVFLCASPATTDRLASVVGEVRQLGPSPPVILAAKDGSEELAIAALRAGVNDYVKLPPVQDELLAILSRSTSRTRVLPINRCFDAVDYRLIGTSLAIRNVIQFLARVAPTEANVLITGETGTGKEIVANLLHSLSRRSHRPLICVNCAAIPDSLLESELFGYEKGAFTGASAPNDGKLRLAHGGTVFFDEIGEMTPLAQAKILRVIETKHVYRLGARNENIVDIRVVAATNQDLETAIGGGAFRKDLYFRLNVARIHLPPLRDRKEDIPPLLEHFIDGLNRRWGTHVRGFADAAFHTLHDYDWPGNVRELRNVVDAAWVDARAPDECLRLPERFGAHFPSFGRPTAERERLLSMLSATNWNKSKAAKKLRWSRMTLYRKMAKYQVASRHCS